MTDPLAVPVSRNPRGPVFVSYRHEQGHEPMVDVRRLLHTAGIPTWIDQDALFAGDLNNNIDDVIRTGASGAVVVLTEDIADPDNFVLERELPVFYALAEQGFFVAVVNTVRDADERIDPSAPERLLAPFWDRFASQKRYRIDTPSARSEFVTEIVRARLPIGTGQPVRVGIQTRPQGQGGNPNDLHYDFRLEPDQLELAAQADVVEWARGVHIVSDRCHAAKGRIQVSGGGHPALALALGASFNCMKFPELDIYQGGADATVWPDKQNPDPPAPPATHHIARLPAELRSGRGDVAVLIRKSMEDRDDAFTALVDSLPFAASYELQVTGPTPWKFPAGEGWQLADRVREELDAIFQRHHGRIHLCFASAFPFAVLVGRRLNTFATIVYDLTKENAALGHTQPRHYEPIAMIEANAADAPPVRPVTDADLWPDLDDGQPLRLVNLTVHTVTLAPDRVPVMSWPPHSPMARLAETVSMGTPRAVLGAPPDPDVVAQLDIVPDAADGGEAGAAAAGVQLEAPIDLVSYGAIENLPTPAPGVGYIVSRVLAERLPRRPDVFFPSREVRDKRGQIAGCEALGRFVRPQTTTPKLAQ